MERDHEAVVHAKLPWSDRYRRIRVLLSPSSYFSIGSCNPKLDDFPKLSVTCIFVFAIFQMKRRQILTVLYNAFDYCWS